MEVNELTVTQNPLTLHLRNRQATTLSTQCYMMDKEKYVESNQKTKNSRNH